VLAGHGSARSCSSKVPTMSGIGRACAAFPGSSVVCVRSPVKTMKSGSNESAFTAATAFCSVPSASGFSAGPLKPQWVSESCTK